MSRFLWLPVLALTAVPALAEETARASAPVLPGFGLQWLAGLATVLIAIILLAFALRRLTRFSRLEPAAFQVMAALSVGTRERVVLLRVGEKQLVLGVAPGRVQALCELSGDQLLKPSETAAGDSFAARLAALRAGKPV